MKERILKLLESTVVADIELAILLSLKHLSEREVDNMYNQSFYCGDTLMNAKLMFTCGEKRYRTASTGTIHRTTIDKKDLISLGYKEVTL